MSPISKLRITQYALRSGQATLFTFRFPNPPLPLDYCATLLSADERDRAAAFKFPHLRDHYTLGRGTLRAILSHYAKIEAGALQFSYDRFRKPRLENSADFHFNVSHAGDRWIVGLSLDGPLGVDIEPVRALPDLTSIARNFFSLHERQVLESVAAAEQPRTFFNCWTRKEAILKAHGAGLTLPLDGFDVTLRPGVAPELLVSRIDELDAEQWELRDFALGDGVIGAVAASGRYAIEVVGLSR